jgi:methenyltetrahydrofolate cyclohydrolase
VEGLGLERVLERLGETAEPASSGSAAAVVGALAAAISAKVARSIGAEGEAAQATSLVTRLTALAQADAEAFGTAREALAAAGEGGDERRDFSLGRLLDHAAAVPADVAEACADVAVLAAVLAVAAGDDWSPDARSASWLATAAARSATHLVDVNLAVGPDDPHTLRAHQALHLANAASETL